MGLLTRRSPSTFFLCPDSFDPISFTFTCGENMALAGGFSAPKPADDTVNALFDTDPVGFVHVHDIARFIN